LQAQTLAAYLHVTDRLRLQMDPANEARILSVLEAQSDKLNQLDVLPQEPDSDPIPPLGTPTATPITPTVPPLQIPPVESTELPQIVPTMEVVPETLPTLPLQDPPKILPTVEIPAIP
jgi:hypothetical protein